MDLLLDLGQLDKRYNYYCRMRCESLNIDRQLPMHFPFTREDVDSFADLFRRAAVSPERNTRLEEQFVRLGATLFRSLLVEEFRRYLHAIRESVDHTPASSCIWLHSQDPLLCIAPWELVYDTAKGGFLVLEDPVSVSRSIRSQDERQRYPPEVYLEDAKVLAVGSSPIDASKPHELDDIDAIERNLTSARRILTDADLTWVQFLRLLKDQTPHILHLVVHGTAEFLSFESEISRRTDRISHSKFVERFSQIPSPKLVVLNACHSDASMSIDHLSTIARSLSEQCLVVVAMRSEISSPAGVEFTKAFYKALDQGKDVASAVRDARIHLSSIDGPESMQWSTPVIYQNTRLIPFPLRDHFTKVTAKPEFTEAQVITRELRQFRRDVIDMQTAILDSTPSDPFLWSTYHTLHLPTRSLGQLRTLERSFDADWTRFSSEMIYRSEQVTKKFELYRKRIEKLLITKDFSAFYGLQEAAIEVGRQVISDLDIALEQLQMEFKRD